MPGVPLRPQIWEDDWGSPGLPNQGLRACEERWAATAAQQPSLSSRLASYQPPMPAWQRRSRQRLPPSRAAPPAVPVRRRPTPWVDEDQDPLSAPVPPPPCSWAGVWGRLVNIELDRDQRVLAWRVLHCSVGCGALRAHTGACAASAAACPHPACVGAPQDLSHMFISCAVAASVWSWLLDVWERLTGVSCPPLCAAVLLADDRRVWQAPTALRPLWQRIRLAALHALWVVACKAARSPDPSPARSVASRIVYGIRKIIMRHWFRVDMRLSDLGSCPHWLVARQPALSLHDFQQWWCPPGPLCVLHDVAGAKPRLQLLWDAHSPVPLPGPGLSSPTVQLLPQPHRPPRRRHGLRRPAPEPALDVPQRHDSDSDVLYSDVEAEDVDMYDSA